MTTDVLRDITENGLLKLARGMYESRHPNEDALYEFGRLTGRSKKHFEQVAAGKGSPGFEAWLIIESTLDLPIFTMWCELTRKRFKSNHTTKTR
jgi:hypothetical protein